MFLDAPPSRLAAELLKIRSAPETGRYRILKVLGEGGMGTVYRAEQDYPHRIVALKVIRAELADERNRRRFQQEAELLGRLQHPGIARIYDAGTSDSGFGPQPWFSMEFIDGRSLVDFAQGSRLEVNSRLALMEKVCDAVHHAHGHGIVHRDLKPGNILVDESDAGHPQPKVLDFGVARLTDAEVRMTRQTDMGQIIGTVAYMSPEQAEGDSDGLDIRTDVYALGVILYELLSGRLPCGVNTKRLHEAVRAIREEEPTSLGRIDRRLRGDIETIVAKALAKERDRRYASAGDMAADIRRYLANEPIVARPPSALYHLQKFARRHRGVTLGIAAVLVTLTAGLVASTWQAVRARKAEHAALAERDRASAAERLAAAGQAQAERERNRALAAEESAMQARNAAVAEKTRADSETAAAKAVNEFLENDVLSQASAVSQINSGLRPDPDLKVKTALDRAAGQIAGKFSSQPEVEASIRETIARAYMDLGLDGEAIPQLRQAVEIQRRNLGAENRKTLSNMALLARALARQGLYAEGAALYSRTLQMERRVLGPDNSETLDSTLGLADALTRQGRYAEAMVLAGRGLEIRRRVLGPEHPDTISAMTTLAGIYYYLGRFAEGEALQQKVVDARHRQWGPERRETLDATRMLAMMYHAEGKEDLAEPLLKQTYEIERRVLGPEHSNTVNTLSDIGLGYFGQRRYSEAEPILKEAAEIQKRLRGPESAAAERAAYFVARVWRLEERYAEAEKLLRDVLEKRRRVPGPEHPQTLETAAALARTLCSEGKFAECEMLAREFMQIDIRTRPQNWHRYFGEAMVGASLAGQQKYAEAEPLLLEGYRRMDAMRNTFNSRGDRYFEAIQGWIVGLYRAWGRPADAEVWAKK